MDSKASIVKALERARDEIVSALNLINTGVINPGAAAPAGDFGSDDGFMDTPAPAAEPAKRGRKPKAQPAPDADPFGEALAEPAQGGEADGGDFFSQPEPAVDTGPTEKMVNDALVAAVASLVAKGNAKVDARNKVLADLEKNFGSKNPAALKPKWAEIIKRYTPKK